MLLTFNTRTTQKEVEIKGLYVLYEGKRLLI